MAAMKQSSPSTRKIKYEQNLELLPLTVIEIDTPDSRLPAIVAIGHGLQEALTFVARYRFISVDRNGRVTSRAEPRVVTG